MIKNFVGYYVVWWSTVLLINGSFSFIPILVFITFILLHLKTLNSPLKTELMTLSTISILGIIFDCSMHFFNFIFLEQSSLLWLPIIWISFAATLNSSMKKIFQLKNLFVFLLGFFGGPIAYMGAARFNLLIYPTHFELIFVHAIFWGLLTLFIKYILKKINQDTSDESFAKSNQVF